MAGTISELLQDLRRAGLPCTADEPLSRHTTFRIGGPAAVFCRPQTIPELTRTLEFCRARGVRTYLLGNGSNVLFADAGFPGAVICLTDLTQPTRFTPAGADRVTVRAGAGRSLAALCREVCAQGLTGLAQVNGRNNISWEDKLAYDQQYVKNITFLGDLKIIFRTVFQVLKKEDINTEGMATAEDFGDYLLRTGQIDRRTYERKQRIARKICAENE